MEKRQKELPSAVAEVISSGSYVESFLDAFDGQSFLLHSEEIVPSPGAQLLSLFNS